jgi:hypothetical protein
MRETVRNRGVGGQDGGETGIRTLDRVSPIHAFQACAFNHSAISPVLETFERERPFGCRAQAKSGYHVPRGGSKIRSAICRAHQRRSQLHRRRHHAKRPGPPQLRHHHRRKIHHPCYHRTNRRSHRQMEPPPGYRRNFHSRPKRCRHHRSQHCDRPRCPPQPRRRHASEHPKPEYRQCGPKRRREASKAAPWP